MMSAFLKNILADQSGATAIEYGLILGLIAIAMIGALQGVADTTIRMWDRVKNEGVAAMTK